MRLYLSLVLVDQITLEVHIAVLCVLDEEGCHLLLFDAIHIREIVVLHRLWKFDVNHFVIDMVDH